MTKIPHQYAIAAEESKLKFQSHVESLSEIQGFLRDKKRNARNQDAIFFNAHEMETIDSWFSHALLGLLTDYEILHRSDKHQQAQYGSVLIALQDCAGDKEKSS